MMEEHADPERVKREYAAKIYRYRQDIFLFIEETWNLVPQPVKPEYQQRWRDV